MELIKSVVRRRRKFAQARSLPLPGFLTCSGIRVSRSGERRDVDAEARKCFPSIVASTGENSL